MLGRRDRFGWPIGRLRLLSMNRHFLVINHRMKLCCAGAGGCAAVWSSWRGSDRFWMGVLVGMRDSGRLLCLVILGLGVIVKQRWRNLPGPFSIEVRD